MTAKRFQANDKDMTYREYRRLLDASLKSEDTEEWLDVYFTRPIGLLFALFWNKLGVHPNAITLLSIVLGVAAGWMFHYTDVGHNAAGVVLLMLANFCDSTDGQMARLTGKKTLVGRILDGFSGDVWFFSIYFALCCRLMGQTIPGTDMRWGAAIWVVAFVAGVLCHSRQSSLADYYRQIHLFFLKGKEGSELDSYASQREVYEGLPREQWLPRLFFSNYANYCRSQERRTPLFQRFFSKWKSECDSQLKAAVGEELLEGSRPLMKWANILTFNVRAICLYITCLADCPWAYFAFEILVLTMIYIYMHRSHEHLCERLTEKLKSEK